MGFFKELWIDKFDELITEYQDLHEGASYEDAVKYAESKIDGRAADAYAELIDRARDEAKYK